MRNYKWVGPWEVCWGLLVAAYQSQAPSSHRPGDRGPIFNGWLEQVVNYFGSLEFSQAVTVRGDGGHSWDVTLSY